MSYKDITAGNKTARPCAPARIIKSPAKGTVGIEMNFQFVENATGSLETLSHVFWLTPQTMERQMKTLVEVLGFNGNDEVNDSGEFIDQFAFDYSREVSLVVELEEYANPTTGEIKTSPRVKWVNAVNTSPFNALGKSEAKTEMAKVGLKAAFMLAKSKLPAAPKPSIDDDLKF